MTFRQKRGFSSVSERAKSVLSDSLESAVSLTREHSALTRYSLAILLSIFFIVIKLGLDPIIGRPTPFLLLLPAVLISAWFGGIGPGLLAVLLTIVGVEYFFLAPIYQINLLNLTSVVELLAYFFESLIVIGVVHWRNKAYAEVKLRAAQQSIIAAISQHGVEEKDLTEFMDRVVKILAQTLDVEYCKILELLPDGKNFRLRAGVGWKRGLIGRALVSSGKESQAGYTLLSQKPVIVKDLAKERRFHGPELLFDHGVVSGMSVVIPGTNGPYGVLGIHSIKKKKFTRHDVNFLRTIAYVLATTIERRQSRRALELMAALSSHHVSTLDPKKTLSGFVKLVVPIFADICEVYVKRSDEEAELVEVEAVQKEKKRILKEIASQYPPVGKSKRPTALSLKNGKPQLFPYITPKWEQSIATDENHLKLIKKLRLQSVMVIPLKIRSQTIGVVAFGTLDKGRIYSDRDIQIAKEIADRMAVAIDNATLYQEAKEAVKARDEFLSIASHELKTPLTSMLLQLQTVLHSIKNQSLATFSIDKTMVMLESTVTQSKRLSRLVNDLLNYSLISTGRLQLERERTDLAKIVNDVVGRLREQAKKSNVSIHIDASKSVIGNWDKVRVEQVVTNLVTNALKYGDGKPIEVSVQNGKSQAVLTVRDHGIGIPKDQQKKIFDRFERGSIKDTYKGLGVGLYIVNQIVQAHGGKISLDSSPQKGTTFIVELPTQT